MQWIQLIILGIFIFYHIFKVKHSFEEGFDAGWKAFSRLRDDEIEDLAKENEGLKNKFDCAVEMAARAEAMLALELMEEKDGSNKD